MRIFKENEQIIERHCEGLGGKVEEFTSDSQNTFLGPEEIWFTQLLPTGSDMTRVVV